MGIFLAGYLLYGLLGLHGLDSHSAGYRIQRGQEFYRQVSGQSAIRRRIGEQVHLYRNHLPDESQSVRIPCC